MAYALGKPILVFYEEGVSTAGFSRMVSEYVTFKRSALADLLIDKPRLVLLTDREYLTFRAENENVREQSIQDDLVETVHQLTQLRRRYGKRIAAKAFRSPPTCFMIATTDHMLLNPYPYMRTAYSSFALIVRRTFGAVLIREFSGKELLGMMTYLKVR